MAPGREVGCKRHYGTCGLAVVNTAPVRAAKCEIIAQVACSRTSKGMDMFRRFKDVSITKKLYLTVGTMALLIGIELLALMFSLNTLSSLRAYVGGEGLWSKAQKDAAFHLYKYGITGNKEEYILFQKFMGVVLGDGRARRELLLPNPNMEVARQGFLDGRNHPDDIAGMINLFRRFHSVYYINRAIEVWEMAETAALQLNVIGRKLNEEINNTDLDGKMLQIYSA